MMEELKKRLLDLLGEEGFRTEESMAKHTTFRTGGPADLFLMPQNRTELKESIALLREYNVPYLVIGNGSNLLVGDGGIRGAVIQLYQRMQNISVEGTEMTLDCGALLSAAAAQAADASLEGLAFASGIPGTFGGAVVMNAGAYGGEMKDVLKEAVVLTGEGEILAIPVEELEMGYRTSIIKTSGYLVLEAVISLEEGDQEEIRSRMKELSDRRTEKQPLDFPSAGSTFKRPEGYFAGKLIMDSGLRGCRIGGAQVSEKHCGFVINAGGATAKDVRALMDHVIHTVHEKFGVTLEPEVKFLGEF